MCGEHLVDSNTFMSNRREENTLPTNDYFTHTNTEHMDNDNDYERKSNSDTHTTHTHTTTATIKMCGAIETHGTKTSDSKLKLSKVFHFHDILTT